LSSRAQPRDLQCAFPPNDFLPTLNLMSNRPPSWPIYPSALPAAAVIATLNLVLPAQGPLDHLDKSFLISLP
jgi:hypothetical protein